MAGRGGIAGENPVVRVGEGAAPGGIEPPGAAARSRGPPGWRRAPVGGRSGWSVRVAGAGGQ